MSVVSTSSQSPTLGGPLPQYGYGSDHTFDRLIQDNHFLFRVYTPKHRSPFYDATEPYFVGQKYNEQFREAADQLRQPFAGQSVASVTTYADVAQHMDWTQRHMSPFISTTFSFAWAIWEATRRYRVGLKHDIEIAIIDARQLAGRAATALELLRKGAPNERHLDYWKWYRFALESQDVLVHGSIPTSAVLASVPLLSIIDKLPSYFLRQDTVLDKRTSSSAFDILSWDTMDRKPSFRQFCQDMSDQFLRLPTEHRLRDATGGSVRLAMAFLRPWFHSVVTGDFTEATETACSLAFVIAQWPAQWWSRDHVEMWDVIRSLVQALGEEIREKQKGEASDEVRRLQGVVSDLERAVQDYAEEAEVASSAGSRNGVMEAEVKASVTIHPSPPASVIECPVPESALVALVPSEAEVKVSVIIPPSPPASVIECPVPESALVALAPTAPAPPVVRSVSQDAQAVVVASSSGSESPHTNRSKTPTLIFAPTIVIHQEQQQSGTEPTPEPESPSVDPYRDPKRRPHSLAETATCIITGLLVGAFITLCVVNSQRRTLIYVT
ncbi:hypothetical protein K503DRAFT_711038 [Rhizopogon vinicolor AM-OR11-026]|uniref:DUF7587 domain-containing protein n=1 Tax=Rhizopogon vinicolor AM-OR11-026 TaxID=1314800 RepID=A0A1B7NBL9_9AGAM|nr:hypothetical protein K503DRAFT_711038 [Rhizopogon vinicolor AM-OR11-026]